MTEELQTPAVLYEFGIDCAKWQGVVGWQAAIDAGCSYAWIKAVHGMSTSFDEQFLRSWNASRGLVACVRDPENGEVVEKEFPRSLYGWLTGANPISQAENIVRALDKAGGDAQLPCAVDNEDTSVPMGNAGMFHVLQALRRVKELTGRVPLHYTGKWFLDMHFAKRAAQLDPDLVAELLTYPLWHSEYPKVALFNRALCAQFPPSMRSPTLHEMFTLGGVREAVWQWDGDGGCTLPNGVDVDYNRMTSATLWKLAGWSRGEPNLLLPNRTDQPTQALDALAFVRGLARND